MRLSRLAPLLVYLLAAALFAAYYDASTIEYGKGSMRRLTAWTGDTPYQYRVLVPGFVNLLQRSTGAALAPTYHVLTILASFGLLLCFRLYLTVFVPMQAATIGALAVLYPIAWNYSGFSNWPYGYVSDIPAIALFTLGLWCLAEQRMRLFYVVFAVATLNRETSCFLSFVYLFTSLSKRQWREVSIHLGAQLAIWCAIKAGLWLLIPARGGSFVALRDFHNVEIGQALLRGEFQTGALAILSMCGFLWLLLPFTWRRQPAFLKHAMLVLVPFYVGMYFVANLDELRIYNELAPILTAPLVVAAWQMWGARSSGDVQESRS